MVGETEADRRRRETQQILASNREDVLARLHEASSPENRKMREYKAHNRVDETIKFEEAPYRFIGASTENAKDRKKAMQEQYLAQLLQDNGGPPQQYHNHNHHQQQQQQQKYQQEQYQQQQQQYQQGRSSHPSPDSRAEYVNRSGWTGLNIGGHSMDEANQGASKNEKFLKQAAYKRLLDQQRLQAEDLVRMDKMKYGKL